MNLSPELLAKVVGIAAAIGVLMPLLQSMLQKPWWSPRAKAGLTVGLAVVGGGAGYIVQNGLDFSDPTKLALWFVGAYTAATTLYARLLRPLGVTDYLEHAVNATPAADVSNPYGAPEVTDGPDESEPVPATVVPGGDGVPVIAPDADAVQVVDEDEDDGSIVGVAETSAPIDEDGDGHDDRTGRFVAKG